MKISLIRHGKTFANENKLYCGKTNLSISQDGERELYSLQKKINYPNGNLFFTSSLVRTIETLKIIYNNVNFKIVKDFDEFNFGSFEMKSYEKLKDNLDYIRWIENIEKESSLNGESRIIFDERIIKAFEKIRNEKVNSVVIITHGGVISNLMNYIFPDEKNFYDWQPSFGRGFTVDFTKDVVNYSVI